MLIPQNDEKTTTTLAHAGRVKSVGHGVIECDAVSLDDVFETYYFVGEAIAESSDSPGSRRRAGKESGELRIQLPTLKNSLGVEFQKDIKEKNDLAWKVGTRLDFSIAPTVYLRTSLVKSKELGTVFKGYIKGNFVTQETLSFYGGLEKSKELGISVYQQPVCPLVSFYIKPGVFYKSAVTATISAGWTQTFGWTFSYDFTEKRSEQPLMTSLKARKPTNQFDIEGSVDGSLTAGVYLEAGVGTLFELGRIALRGEYGVELTGHAVLYNSDIANASLDTKAYEILKSSSLEANLVYASSTEAKLFDKQLNFPVGPSWNYSLAKWDLVPTFSNMEFLRNGTTGDASATLSGQCLMPLRVGLTVTDKEGNKVDSWNANDKYQKDGGQISTSFTGLKRDNDYVLSPKLVIFDIDMKASPSVGLTEDEFPVRIVSFEQTGSHYSKQQGYEYDGRNYFYKFNATTTVTLADKAENVKDWGYIYHDIYGADKKISCANLSGRTYADQRYAYYHNDPQRTVELSPYVQYNDDAAILQGKLKVFGVEHHQEALALCPDENHPHIIDLGLPSGTKWACCNLGADEPEGEGDHYLWGSTKPLSSQYHYQKETRNNSGEDSYTYKEPGSAGYDEDWIKIPVYWREWGTEEGWNDLDLEDYEDYIPFYDMSLFGSNLKDIGGTKYDAATANWGGLWRMPTQAQCQELIDNCTVEHLLTGSYETPVNFVLTGPNGNRILIPSYIYRHEYSSCQDERHGYRLTNEKHWYETSLWTSDTSPVKHLLLRYIYDWYDPCYYATEGGGLVHEYPQPQITEKSEQSMYPKNMDAPLVVRPVQNQ